MAENEAVGHIVPGYVGCEKNSGSSCLHHLKSNGKPLRVKVETD